MLTIDSHQHFWNLQRLRYPWLSPDLAPLYRNFEPPDLAPQLQACGVSATIVVQATHDRAETDWLLELARATPFIKGVVAWLDLGAPDLDEQLDACTAQGPLCGVRHQVHDEPDPEWLLRPEIVRGLQTLARRQIAYDLLVRPTHLPLLPRLFDLVPDGRWVIDHLAKPPIARGVLEPWARDLGRVAQHPQVCCKLSGMITEAEHARWTIDDLRPYVERAIELFGPERLLFGSDWPVCLLAGGYERVHAALAALIGGLSPHEQAAIWGGAARRIYQLEITDATTAQ
jgi:L-fuconolactonase